MRLSRPDHVNVAALLPRTRVEGPGERFALWVQGCSRRCPGCCNPHLQPFVESRWLAVEALTAQIRAQPGIDGLSLLGGEPFDQAPALAHLARAVQRAGLGVIAFSGYTRTELEGTEVPGAAELLAACDLLVDGPFVCEAASHRRRWIGSDNQQVHALTSRYADLVASWPAGDGGAELRLVDGRVLVNGHPRPELVALAQCLGVPPTGKS